MKMNEKEIKLVSLILINFYLIREIHFLSNELSLETDNEAIIIT